MPLILHSRLQHHSTLILCLCTTIVISSLASTGANAKTAYITDQLRVELRTGASDQHRIISYIRSGSALQIIEQDAGSDWVKVRGKTKEGYVRKQYLVTQPVARDQLAAMRAKVSSAKQTQSQQADSMQAVSAELSQLQRAHKEAEKEKSLLSKRHEKLKSISSNAVKLDQQNRMLLEKQEAQKIELEQLRQDNLRLKNDEYIDGLIYGALAVIAGALLAMLIPRIQVNRRRDQW